MIREYARVIKNSVDSAARFVYKNDPIQEKVDFYGIPIALEWLKGQERRTKGIPAGAKPWVMQAHYGYIRGTESWDGEEIDVYFNPEKPEKTVFLIVQLDSRTGDYDELKYMLGFHSEKQAEKAYTGSTAPGMFGGIYPVKWNKFLDECNVSHETGLKNQ